MASPHCDVIIVGAGAAGLTAAIGLGRAGFRVAVVEAAAFAGAENWSGCVYFAENLAHPDILGIEGVEALAWERRLMERGFFATDGHGLLGMTYRDADAFRHCYTVLRPIYDHHLSQFAVRHGARLLTNTTVESLIRENGRVIGVCTNRGALYAKLTFLAEGDASHLVTREGYERSKDKKDQPKFLQGIKQVLELPPRAIEERFGVGAEQGVAYEMVLRNGTLRGKNVRLNMGGFLYTNRQSLSVGLVLPADNLHEHFEGDPNLLMEWFLRLPSLQPWFAGAKQGPFGAKIIRGGGAKDVPTLIDDGLAIGGAASAIGIDFPYPNFTGPATAMGLLITGAARKIRDEGGDFNREELDRHYLQPLRKTHYWQDVEFLRKWPGYVKKTSFFFGRNIDVALGSAYLWTRPGKSFAGRWQDWLSLVREQTGGENRAEVETDLRHFSEALRVGEVVEKPSPWRLLLDGTLNTFRDLVGAARALPAHGAVTLHYSVAGGAEPGGLPPAELRKWFTNFAPAIAAAARVVYSNDTVPLAKKLPMATQLLTRHVSLADFARALSTGLMVGVRWLFGTRNAKPGTQAYFSAARTATDLTPASVNATAAWDARLAQLSYDTSKASHIHVLWPTTLENKNDVTKAGLWHVCPAHVYEARVNAAGQLQVVVNFENCIKCETCWRTSDIVDWARDGAQRFVYAVHSPVVEKLLSGVVDSGQWAVGSEGVVSRERERPEGLRLVQQLERKLVEFDEALAEEPRTIDRDRAAYLEMLARYAHQLALELFNHDAERSNEIVALTQKRMEHVAAGRYSWAASDGRQLRFHHLTTLLQSSDLPEPEPQQSDLRTNSSLSGPSFAELRDRLDANIPPTIWRELEQQKPLSADQDAILRETISHLPPLDSSKRGLLVRRQHVLSHLAGRDPSLAYWLAVRLCARDNATGNASESVSGPVKTLGLRGVWFSRDSQTWQGVSSFDLAAIAQGMADYLCQRAIEHASGRVQFPGLFHDEESRDAIGKFGAVKKMIAEMAAYRHLIYRCFSTQLARDDNARRVDAVKAIFMELLGTSPGSISYNAGQVFGGTGYSEDDTLSKFYRDASTLRFNGVPASEAFARRGTAIMQSWSASGDQLSRLADEKKIFASIEQRQALAEQVVIVRRHESLLIEAINQWKYVDQTLHTPYAQPAFCEAIGKQDALLYCSKLLLDWTHRVIEDGCSYEVHIPLLRVWLDKTRSELHDFTILVDSLKDVGHPPLANAPGSPITQYADFLKTDLPYSSGDFLSKPTDPTQPRYVPEMIETDAFLSKRNQELIDLITRQFGQPRNGMVYERYLESQHRPDAADLDFLREHGFFRNPIPKELGGEGRSKADYYLLTVNTHRLADAAISLTIQVNSSLGTTPVLLARDKDLPKAIKDAKEPALVDELTRRREACDLFCRWVASGQISAFALTEPSAGSDTARVGTRAKLRQVIVEKEADGVYRFIPASGKQARRLLDARRMVFDAKLRATYKYSDAAEAAAICFDEYDYETDACKKRYFVADGQRVYFDDIAQLRERDGKLWYDYWELTGAKMWITNGRIMGIMVLYAKTDKGVTGFMVDRHAEGMIVGKDEAKMGQNGSPTNELALQLVRVPRENVVGLEGRGQVNALETLNVGRAGLAMSAMCQMVRLCDWSRDFARQRYGEIPAWIGWRLDRMEQERFISEAMAYEIIGRFEHKQTKSIRMESAIAKMLVSELFHHSIELAEEIHGPDGQTTEHLIEKRKRDARVLNIYEGTNEIQRFLILKELTELAPSWASRPHERPENADQAAEIDALKVRLRGLVTEAVQLFGQQLWQNPNLQANCFVLAEAVAWIMAAESALGRLTWLQRKGHADVEWMAAGRRALIRCKGEVRTRLERFAEDLVDLRRGHYSPEIRAASLLMQRKDMPENAGPKNVIAKPLSLLVILDPPTPGVPQPRAEDGKLMEPYRVLTDGDRAALEMALRLRDDGSVRIEIAMVAATSAAMVLRETINLGVDRVRLVAAPGAVGQHSAASALADTLRGDKPFDLVLGGAGGGDAQEGLVARLAAEALGVPFAGTAAKIAIYGDDNAVHLLSSAGQMQTRSLPAAMMIEPGLTLRHFTIDGWLQGLAKNVEIIEWPANVAMSNVEFEQMASAATADTGEKPPQPLMPREASQLLLEAAGVESALAGRHLLAQSGIVAPTIVDVAYPSFARHGSVSRIVAVLASDADGKLRPSARRTLDAAQFLTPFFEDAAKAVLLLVPRRDEAQQRAVAEMAAMTPFDFCLLAVDDAATSDEIHCRLLAECWTSMEKFPVAVVGEPWSEAALATLATASGKIDAIALRVRLLDRHQSELVAEGTCAKGKLRTRQTLQKGPGIVSTTWIGLTGDAEVGAAAPAESQATRRVERWSPALDKFYARDDMRRLLENLKQDTGLVRLSDAEFIIDVGFGVGNRDGYEAVIEPLEKQLRELKVRGLTVGGSRKVTEELHLLPADRQIGQSGVSVNPRILLAIGVSGAPQHLNYIGQRATIIAFNRDPEAPLMTLNQRQVKPRVYPVIGDLFETVPAFVACLREDGTADIRN